MIGFIVTPEQAQAANNAVALAQTSRDLPVFWLPGGCPTHSGQHSGMVFVPCDEKTISTPLRGTPAQTPADFPEFQQIIASLGGLNARVDIDPSILIDPNAFTDA